MLYSVDLRKKVMDYAETHTDKEAAAKFDVSIKSIGRWRKLYRETGSLKQLPLNRKPRKVDLERLREYIDNHPDEYIREIAAVLGYGQESVRRNLIKMGYTRKMK
jgi:transposase